MNSPESALFWSVRNDCICVKKNGNKFRLIVKISQVTELRNAAGGEVRITVDYGFWDPYNSHCFWEIVGVPKDY